MEIKDEIEIKYESTASVEEYVSESILNDNGFSENAVFVFREASASCLNLLEILEIENFSNSWNSTFVYSEDVGAGADPLDLEEKNDEDQDKSNEEISQKRNTINVVALINLVFERKPLWDRQRNYCLGHRNRLWEEVARELNSTANGVKMKWGRIRNKYRSELKKITKSGSQNSEWPFFRHLLFLSTPVKYGKREGNIQGEICEDIHKTSDIEEPNQNASPNVLQPSISTNQSVFKAPLKKKIKLPPDPEEEMRTLEEQFLEIEKEKLRHFEENGRRNNDSDYQFLVSLLPFLRDVPYERKLLVRGKLLQVFVEEQLYKDQQVPYYTTYPSPSSSSSNGIRLSGRKDSTAPSPQSHSSSESV